MNDDFNKEADVVEEQEALEDSAQELDIIQKKLEVCLMQQHEWKDKYLRATSDFENYRRRIAKDQISWTESAQSRVLVDLLDIVDNFERALHSDGSSQEKLAGFSLIYQELLKILSKWSVEPMDNYASFDPQFHEALGQTASPDHQTGSIIEVLQKGYVLKGSVLRPARVIVAQ